MAETDTIKTEKTEKKTKKSSSSNSTNKFMVMLFVEMGLLFLFAVVLVLKLTNVIGTNKSDTTASPAGTTQQAATPTQAALTSDERQQVLDSSDALISDMISTTFPGDYAAPDGREFFFSSDGTTFIGYVAPGYEDVRGTYIAQQSNGVNYCTIRTADGSVERNYIFEYSLSGGIILTDPSTGEVIELE